MSGKHTPGPWVVGFDAVNLPQKQQVTVGFPEGIPGTLREHSEANTALVSAAPDLLAACEAIIDDGTPWAPDTPAMMAVRAAIKKARGGR